MPSREYKYEPSMAAAVIFVIAFSASATLHTFQMLKTRTWFLIPLCVGAWFEVIGYICRAIGAGQDFGTWTSGPFIIQSILLLVAPALYAASIYMQLGRVSLLVHAPDSYLIIPRRWLTRFFVTGDVISFLAQAAGGGLWGTKKRSSERLGSKIIVVGLFIQIVFFGGFVLSSLRFHRRLHIQPPQQMVVERPPYKRHMLTLYATSTLIFMRSIVRVVEFLQGFSGYIASHEVFLYVFDAVPMLLVVVLFNWIHPSEVASWVRNGGLAFRSLRIVECTPLERRKTPENR